MSESTLIGILLKPLFLLVVVCCILIPARLAVQKWMPDCWLKRLLLYRVRKGE